MGYFKRGKPPRLMAIEKKVKSYKVSETGGLFSEKCELCHASLEGKNQLEGFCPNCHRLLCQ